MENNGGSSMEVVLMTPVLTTQVSSANRFVHVTSQDKTTKTTFIINIPTITPCPLVILTTKTHYVKWIARHFGNVWQDLFVNF